MRFWFLRLIIALFIYNLAPLTAVSSEEVFNSPEALVRQFQADYLQWNNQSFALRNVQDISVAERAYAELLRKYTLPEFQGEPIAFGSNSSHDPDKEKTISVTIKGSTAILTTQYPELHYTSAYEYHLINQQQRWYLIQVYFIDNKGRYPNL